MDCDVFPCILCDDLDGSVCMADALQRDVHVIPLCPLSTSDEEKPDIGHWVVRQPDGLFCYYDETTGSIERRDMTLQEIIRYREETCRMSYAHAESDTLSQLRHQIVKWEDVTRRTDPGLFD